MHACINFRTYILYYCQSKQHRTNDTKCLVLGIHIVVEAYWSWAIEDTMYAEPEFDKPPGGNR